MRSILFAFPVLAACHCEVNPPKEVSEGKTALLNLIANKLECQEYGRPSTINRIRSVVENPSLDTAKSLFLHPEQVADVVSLLGPEFETLFVLGRNVHGLAKDGHLQQVATNGFSSLQCDDSLNLACTAGSALSSIQCTNGNQDAIEVNYQRCMLNGTLLDGSLRIQSQDNNHSLQFSNLTLDEIHQTNGKVALLTHDDSTTLTLIEPPLAILTHGGAQSDVGCGNALTLSRFQMKTDAHQTTLSFDGIRQDDNHQFKIKSDQITFNGECACPQPGSSLSVELAKPADQDDQLGQVEIQWLAPTQANSCAHASVRLTQWPSNCPGKADCGKATTEEALSRIFTALCTQI